MTCSDAGVGVEQCIVPNLTTTTTGQHTVHIVAWDFNGNVSSLDVEYTVVSASGALGTTGPENAERLSALAAALVLAGMVALSVVVVRSRRGRETP